MDTYEYSSIFGQRPRRRSRPTNLSKNKTPPIHTSIRTNHQPTNRPPADRPNTDQPTNTIGMRSTHLTVHAIVCRLPCVSTHESTSICSWACTDEYTHDQAMHAPMNMPDNISTNTPMNTPVYMPTNTTMNTPTTNQWIHR